MKVLRKSFYTLLLYLCSCASHANSERFAPDSNVVLPFNLIENKGIKGIKTDISTQKDVIETFGEGYIVERPDSKLCVMKYPKLGLSFWYLWADSTKVIDRICASPFIYRGYTGNGLQVSDKLTVKDVIHSYTGSQYKWYLDGDKTLYLDFANDGIVFKVSADTNFRHINRYLSEHADSLLTEIYENSKVVQISIPW
jgi:hypothetical protein